MPLRTAVEDGIFVIRATGVVKLDDLATMSVEIKLYEAQPNCRRLFLSDSTELKVIAPEAVEALIGRMRDASHVVRAAIVVREGTSALQLSRILRDAPSDKRRTFTSLGQALAWLRSA